MFESDAPISATGVGYVALVASVLSGTALLALCVYRTVRNCRGDDQILRAALLDEAV